MRLDLSPGLQAANLIHAAGESSPGNLPHGTYAIALTAPDELALRSLAIRLGQACIDHVRIVETEGKHAGELMAIGIAPQLRERLRPFLSSLPLLKGGTS